MGKYDTGYFDDYLKQNNILYKVVDLDIDIKGLAVKKEPCL